MNTNTKIVMITGCLGFIGSYITERCLNEGYIVYGVDSETYAANLDLLEKFKKYNNFNYQKIDINDIKKLPFLDFIINTAAETHVDNSIECAKDFIKSNISGVHNLLNLIESQSGHRPTLLHFSTDEVYGDIKEGSFDESAKLTPSNPYAATKAAADHLIQAFGRTHNIPYIIVRPTNNYGIGQHIEKLIPKSIRLISMGRKVPLHCNGSPTRTWLHVEDTANIIMQLMNIDQSKVLGQVFNISGSVEHSNYYVVYMICSHMKVDVKNHIDFSYERKGVDIRYSVSDCKLTDLGITRLEKDFDKSLKSIIDAFKQNPWIR